MRLFHIYYPSRIVTLLLGEALTAATAFALATLLAMGPDAASALYDEGGVFKIGGIVAAALLFSYYLDLYAPRCLPSKTEIHYRLVLLTGVLALALSLATYLFPEFEIGPHVFFIGLLFLLAALSAWRGVYDRLLRHPLLREKVFVLGSGELARRVIHEVTSRRELGMDLVGLPEPHSISSTAADCGERLNSPSNGGVERIIIAMTNRRNSMPVRDLLLYRLRGVEIEEASALIERISCKIDLDALRPSTIIFGEGFRLRLAKMLARRGFSILFAACLLLAILWLLPILALLVKLSSPGPVLFKQTRTGWRGEPFTLYKFRSMRANAEVDTGAVWALRNDPRITRVGLFLRRMRLDELPQLWNVLRGDMGFVGPRPERPEFVQSLAAQIPYYNLRHIIRPGLTGWAQVRYQYGSSVEDARQKLEYDLYYIKHVSLSLDLAILFETLKTVLLRRGSQ